MSIFSIFFKNLTGKQFKSSIWNSFTCSHVRKFADKLPDPSSKQIMVRGTENEPRLRVRRARPTDTPRVLRFVRDHARSAWPGLATPPAESQLVLCDYVARALSQGHSMLAEQQEMRPSVSQIRGLALSVAVSPWDATMLEKWARCVRCARGRRLMAFTAHCLRAPALHDKYSVHNILQVILIVPQDCKKKTEIINLLANNSIKRGQEIGYPLIRFDVTCDEMEKCLEELDFKKEWQLSYDVLNEGVYDLDRESRERSPEMHRNPTYKNRITVYTAQTYDENFTNIRIK